MKKAAIVVSLTVVFSIVTQRSSKWKPIKTLHLTKESFQNKNTSTQSHLGEHGPLTAKLEDRLTAKLVNSLTTKLEDHFTAKLMDCFTAKLEDPLTAKLEDRLTT